MEQALLKKWIEEARAAHPSIVFDEAAFAAHVMSLMPTAAAEGEEVPLRAPDLLVAFACSTGDRIAIEIFERACFEEISFALTRVRTDGVSVDEVKQMMRERLFVRNEKGAPPKILQYSGGGDLRAWFRVVVTRHLLNLATRATSAKETELDQAMLDILPVTSDGSGENGGGDSPETAHARREYGPALREAFLAALAALEPRSRTMLRLAVCDGLTVDAIGSLYNVHRATAARWIVAARDELQVATKAQLRARIGGGAEESITTLMRMLGSRMDISLRPHLVTTT